MSLQEAGNGRLDHFLRSQTRQPLALRDRLAMVRDVGLLNPCDDNMLQCRDVACGLQCLKEQQIIHANLTLRFDSHGAGVRSMMWLQCLLGRHRSHREDRRLFARVSGQRADAA